MALTFSWRNAVYWKRFKWRQRRSGIFQMSTFFTAWRALQRSQHHSSCMSSLDRYLRVERGGERGMAGAEKEETHAR